MKPSMVSFLITLLLAAAVSTHGQELVKDSAGNPLEVGKQYFIQPVKTENNNGGGLVPAAINLLPFCPLGITQTLLSNQPGLPVRFGHLYVTSSMISDTVIEISSPVIIEFVSNIWPVCNEFSKLWKVDVSSSADKKPAILIGGKPLSQESTFKIEKAGEEANTYKLTTLIGTVGTIPGIWGGAPQLVVTDDTAKTLLVKFKKVDDVATTVNSRVEKLGLRMFPSY